jgi:amino acid adenylation domain-containing protein
MQTNVLEYLENAVQKAPNKLAYSDGTVHLTFKDVSQRSLAIGTFLIDRRHINEPVLIFMKRSPETITAYYGTIYAGSYYVPIDEEMPSIRMSLIIETVKPKAMICDRKTAEVAEQMNFEGTIYLYDDIVSTEVNLHAIEAVRKRVIDIDPIYVVFTSGSTGVPKGVVACHRSVIDYIDQLSEILNVSEDTVFGNQTPLYLDACLKELFPTLKHTATAYIIPKQLFMFPVKLIEFMNLHKINTVCWVVSALTIISSLKAFDKVIPEHLKTVAFGSEVFPVKQFNLWKKTLPEARFINLYGPTEATGMSTFYEADRFFEEDEIIPIGKAFKNTDVMLITEDNQLAEPGEIGEICIRGTSVTMGYYGAFDKTNTVFVQNPLNPHFLETIYKTGDIGRKDPDGNLYFVSRKDHQIKHMGHRIELGEIEMNANRIEGIHSACCIYDKKTEKINLFYDGTTESKEVLKHLKEALPRYMVPTRIHPIAKMPLTANGKIDRVYLKSLIENGEV